MNVIICMLRGVNVGGHNQMKMDALRALCESVGLCDPETYVQSGNIIFRTEERNLVLLARRIENAIEKRFGFRPEVILRTSSDPRQVIARNPFAKRRGTDPSKLQVTFFAKDPDPDVRDEILRIKADPEELHIEGRELYIYFPNGMGRSKLAPVIGKTVKKSGTARNWNTVTKLLEMAQRLEVLL